MNRVYVLVNVNRGAAQRVQDEIRKLEGVSEVSLVSGRYDIFVKIEGKTLPEITDTIVNKIHKLDGIERTESLISLSMDISGEEESGIKII